MPFQIVNKTAFACRRQNIEKKTGIINNQKKARTGKTQKQSDELQEQRKKRADNFREKTNIGCDKRQFRWI